MIDLPNERSSHIFPTPRGGGLSITISIFFSVALLYYFQLISLVFAVALGLGGLVIAVVGWLDDHGDISVILRGIAYSLAAIWTIYWIEGMDHIVIGKHIISLNSAGALIAFLWLVWVTNLYNFMDGTDALAAVQAVCTGIMSGILLIFSGEQGLAMICFAITVACFGFLFWNWPPAKIFMGDVGSCMLGFCFGVLAIFGEKIGVVPIIIWFILLSVFICDATFTLIMRIIRNEKWYSAHRSHAYQRLVQMGVGHKSLAIYVSIINIFVLWPLAYIAYQWQQFTIASLIITVLVMLILWLTIQYRFYQQS